MKKRFKKLRPIHALRRKRQQIVEQRVADEQPPENLPKITNETVAAHREEVISSARKYVYPMQHSKHKIVLVSTGLFITAIVVFFSYCVLALYRFQNTSTFMYRVTQVIPFPVARKGNDFIAYENYLFELRRYVHYYQTQQKLDFKSDAGKQQLTDTKKRMLQKVVNEAYIKNLAAKYKVSVSNQEVDDQIAILRSENRLGGSDKVFEDVLKDFWGWSVDDFKRSLKEELLAQKLVAKLDTDTQNRAQAAMAELRAGTDFSAVAKKYSDDTGTKDNGGEFGFLIDSTNRDVSAETAKTLFGLQPGQYSDVVNIGYSLEIDKNIEKNGDKIRGAHIVFNFKDINKYLDDLKDKQKYTTYIHN